jgi:glycosyltransferase involved in cell wall biosynthesis
MSSISVIIPTYNCAQWLERAVQSVLSQGFQELEVIIVDDGSTDATAKMVKPWVASGAVKYIFQQNRGLPASRNAGARVATGEYLAFLDADDALAPGALRQMSEAMDQSGASWCLIDIVRVADSASEVQQTVVPEDDPFYGILAYNFVRRGMFFRSSGFFDAGMYDEAIRMCEDWELNIRMFEQRRSHVYVPEPLYLYTKREGSITTGRVAENLAYTEKVFRKHHKRLADAGDKRAAQLYGAHMWDIARKYRYSVHLPIAATRCMRESLVYDFNWSRLLHPIGHMAGKAFHRVRGEAVKQAG